MSKLHTKSAIVEFLKQEGFEVTEKEDGDVLVISDEDDFIIFSAITDAQIEFVVDICGEKDLKPEKLLETYKMLLHKNTEIQPTCYGINDSEIQLFIIGSQIQKQFKDLFLDDIRLSCRFVYFIDYHDRLKTKLQRFLQHKPGLRHRTFLRINHQNHAID